METRYMHDEDIIIFSKNQVVRLNLYRHNLYNIINDNLVHINENVTIGSYLLLTKNIVDSKNIYVAGLITII